MQMPAVDAPRLSTYPSLLSAHPKHMPFPAAIMHGWVHFTGCQHFTHHFTGVPHITHNIPLVSNRMAYTTALALSPKPAKPRRQNAVHVAVSSSIQGRRGGGVYATRKHGLAQTR